MALQGLIPGGLASAENDLDVKDGSSAAILELPFPTFPDFGLDITESSTAVNSSFMPINSGSVRRKPLDKAYVHRYSFLVFPTEDCFPVDATAPVFTMDASVVMTKITLMMLKSGQGFPAGADSQKMETEKLSHIRTVLNDMLLPCQFKMYTGKAPDVTFVTWPKREVVLLADGKDSKGLPQRTLPTGLSPNLCLFGAATYLIAQYVIKGESEEAAELQQKLYRQLDLTGKRKKAPKTKNILSEEHDVHTLLESLMRIDMVLQRDDCVASVLLSSRERLIDSDAALQLYGATIQACNASVIEDLKYTIVMSVEFMWFIKLRVVDADDEERCQILTADPVAVGAPGCPWVHPGAGPVFNHGERAWSDVLE